MVIQNNEIIPSILYFPKNSLLALQFQIFNIQSNIRMWSESLKENVSTNILFVLILFSKYQNF